MTDRLLAKKDGAIGWMVFNNPERRNAVSLDMWQAIPAVLDGFEKDPEVRVVVLARDDPFDLAQADVSRLGCSRLGCSRIRFSRIRFSRIRFSQAGVRLCHNRPLDLCRELQLGNGL